MTSEMLAVILASCLSLAASYIPSFTEWFDALTRVQKQLFQGGLTVVIAAAVFGLACAGLAADLGVTLVCTVPGAIGLLKVVVAALIANQTTYLLTRK